MNDFWRYSMFVFGGTLWVISLTALLINAVGKRSLLLGLMGAIVFSLGMAAIMVGARQ